MAQFIPFSENVEVTGQTVIAFIMSVNAGQDSRAEILKKHGIENPEANKWYPQKNYLSAYKEVAEKVGPNTLFSIGKSIPEHAAFPPEIDNLEKALNMLNVAYKMNHRGGEIGYYKLLDFNVKEKKAVFECKNPYPSEFDRGLITALVRKFRPENSLKQEVILDTSRATRLNGAETCTYNISW